MVIFSYHKKLSVCTRSSQVSQ